MAQTVEAIRRNVEQQSQFVTRLREEIARIIVGQEYMIDRLLIGLLANGHVLIEGVPGLAKTTAVKTLAQALNCTFSRIQFTPDLLPADLIGTQIYNPKDGAFSVKKGPIFGNIILADEINRAPAKVQSALLEAMQERQVTIGQETFELEAPFMVLATQNPIEQEGTYPLPEAQLDRFMFNVQIDYPSEQEELQIIKQTTALQDQQVEPLLTGDDVMRIQSLVRQVPIADHVARYVLRLVRSTRIREASEKPAIVKEYVSWGAGPRASQYIVLAAKAKAVLCGATHVMPEHIQAVALPVLRHRIITNFNAEADGITTDEIVTDLLQRIPVQSSDDTTSRQMDAVVRS